MIAVKCVDLLGAEFFAGELQHGGVQTDKSWRCTSVEEAGWYMEHFNDSSWPYAKDLGATNIDGISSNARKIWTHDGALTIYCRKLLHTGNMRYLYWYMSSCFYTYICTVISTEITPVIVCIYMYM